MAPTKPRESDPAGGNDAAEHEERLVAVQESGDDDGAGGYNGGMADHIRVNRFWMKRYGPSRRCAKGISGSKTFRSPPQKDFCNNICHKRKNSR